MARTFWYFYLSCLSTLNCQQSLNYTSGFPTLTLIPMEVSALVICDSLYPPICTSNLRGNGLPCDLTSLTDLRRVTDFSVFSAFHLWLGWSDNCQSYLLDWKPQSLIFIFN